eukprot:COSAG04_NODE_34_length_34523_cov_40.302446_16_plen_110_part_00
MEIVDSAQMDRAVAMWAAYTYVVGNLEEMLPRLEPGEEAPTQEVLCVCGYSVIGPTFFRPYLAHFFPVFSRFFAVPSVWPPRFQKPAPRPRKTVQNGRETVAKRGSKTV